MNLSYNDFNTMNFFEILNIIQIYDEHMKERAKTYPLGKVGDSKKDIAPTIELLISDKSLWTTGAIYVIDGGKSL